MLQGNLLPPCSGEKSPHDGGRKFIVNTITVKMGFPKQPEETYKQTLLDNTGSHNISTCHVEAYHNLFTSVFLKVIYRALHNVLRDYKHL